MIGAEPETLPVRAPLALLFICHRSPAMLSGDAAVLSHLRFPPDRMGRTVNTAAEGLVDVIVRHLNGLDATLSKILSKILRTCHDRLFLSVDDHQVVAAHLVVFEGRLDHYIAVCQLY